jgi:pimeloyl-ACP methyl ester carboxylesterase
VRARAAGSGRLLVKLFHPSWRLRAGESFTYLDPEARARDLSGSAIPVTIVQGDLDTRVPPAHASRLAAALGADVLTVEGAAHREILGRPEVHREIVRFVKAIAV